MSASRASRRIASRRASPLLGALALVACVSPQRDRGAPTSHAHEPRVIRDDAANDAGDGAAADAGADAAHEASAMARPAQLDPDGNDEDGGEHLTLPASATFTKVGRHWAALGRVCDFARRGGALWMSHATEPLGLTGATITRYEPGAKTPFSLVFDWNRPGEPERGGAGGQGFLRIRAIGGRFWVPDADPPYLGLGVRFGVEGYLFASDSEGRFAGAARPGHRPPKLATAEQRGTVVLPGALHVFDVIQFRGKLYASAGAVIPASVTARSSPGTLFVQGNELGVWEVAHSYAGAPGETAVRLGYMTRFRDSLYVAISPLEGIDRNDYIVIAPPRDATTLDASRSRAFQATESGGAHTLRWYVDRGRLYWITVGADGGALRVTDDGERWQTLKLPAQAGHPTDVLRAGEHLLVMAERALLALEGPAFRVIARVSEAKSPFALNDAYCAAPLVVLDGKLYVGGQRRGALYRVDAEPAAP